MQGRGLAGSVRAPRSLRRVSAAELAGPSPPRCSPSAASGAARTPRPVDGRRRRRRRCSRLSRLRGVRAIHGIGAGQFDGGALEVILADPRLDRRAAVGAQPATARRPPASLRRSAGGRGGRRRRAGGSPSRMPARGGEREVHGHVVVVAGVDDQDRCGNRGGQSVEPPRSGEHARDSGRGRPVKRAAGPIDAADVPAASAGTRSDGRRTPRRFRAGCGRSARPGTGSPSGRHPAAAARRRRRAGARAGRPANGRSAPCPAPGRARAASRAGGTGPRHGRTPPARAGRRPSPTGPFPAHGGKRVADRP